MNDLSGIKDQNRIGTVRAYQNAIQSGAADLATRIREANPNLKHDFHVIDKVIAD